MESRVPAIPPLMGVQRDRLRGPLLIIPEIGMLMSYWVQGSTIHVMRVLHQKQQFPDV
jgi:toxin ParE1/3/4